MILVLDRSNMFYIDTMVVFGFTNQGKMMSFSNIEVYNFVKSSYVVL